MKTILIDTEDGAASVSDRIEVGDVERHDCRTFAQVQAIVQRIERGEIKGDVLVLDPVTTLATTTRQDIITHGKRIGGSDDMWATRKELFPVDRDWGNMTDLLCRLLRRIRDLNMLTIFTFHEGMREDPMTGIKLFAPDLNPALLRDVVAFSDAIFRIAVSSADIEAFGVKQGDRVIRTDNAGSQYMAKMRIPHEGRERIPTLIAGRDGHPNLEDLQEMFGKYMPRKLSLYGPVGGGKTTFANSGPVVSARAERKEPISA